jgi:ParB family chromosome partitioning protein
MQTIEYIETLNIRSSDLNPRKTFDDDSINELSKSIVEVGILQPIILRASKYKKGVESYELVCGERRWRAAKVAELKTVPAIIRELKDQEALDLMITENLQRKDVSPLEEAEAFQNLITHRKYDIPTLVARFGKTESYIRHRVKLNDLIPNFKTLLQNEVIGIGHALEICKLQEKDQGELYKDKFSEDDRSRSWWNCPTVKTLKGNIETAFTLKLQDAPFSADDTTIDKKAGACITCPKNTASNLILFPDSPSTGVCLDRVCFKKKSDIHFDRELKRIQEEEPGIVLAYPNYTYGEAEKKLKDLKKKGIEALEISWNSGWSEVNEPELPEKPVESDFEPEEYKEALSEYEGEMVDYENELKEYQEKVNSGSVRKAFMLVGRDEGKFIYIEPNGKSKSTSNTSGEVDLTKQQIEELQAKIKRDEELNFEKLYNAAKTMLNDSAYKNNTDPLTEKEWIASYVIMMKRASMDLNEEIFDKDSRSYVKNELRFPAAYRLTDSQKNKVFRSWMINELETSSPNYLISESKSLIEIAREKFPDQLTQVELELQGRFLKRKEKTEKLIADLNAKSKKK